MKEQPAPFFCPRRRRQRGIDSCPAIDDHCIEQDRVVRSISISIPIIGLLGIVLIFCLVRFRSQTASGLPAPDGGTLPKPTISFTEAATKRSHPDDQAFSPSLSENSGDAGPDAGGVDPEDIPSITDREKLLEIGFMWTEAKSDRLQEKFNFSDSDLTYVKDQASHLATSIISLAKSNLREDYFRHRPEKGVYAYRLPAFKGRAERNRDFVEALSQRFGAAKGERIASMILGDRSTRARVIAPTLLGTTPSMADPPHYEREPLDDNSPFFRTDGILSYRVVDAMGLTKEQALAVQAAYTGFLDEIAALATERLTIDYENFDQDLGVTAFVIGAFGDKVESAFSSLRDSLAHTLGNETSESFCESIRKNDSYPGWGEYELRLQVKEAWDEPAAAVIDIDIVDEHGNIIEHIDQGYEARPGIFEQQGVMHKIFEITDPDATIFGSQSSTESN